MVRAQLWVEYEVLGSHVNVTGRSSDLLCRGPRRRVHGGEGGGRGVRARARARGGHFFPCIICRVRCRGFRAAAIDLARLLTDESAGMLDGNRAVALLRKAWDMGAAQTSRNPTRSRALPSVRRARRSRKATT